MVKAKKSRAPEPPAEQFYTSSDVARISGVSLRQLQWWDARWTHGTRYSLEHMSPEILAQFKSEVFARLEEAQRQDGIYEERNLEFIIGTR